MKNYLRKSTLKGLTADCVRRNIKIMKTVYRQELNKIKDKWCRTDDLYSQSWCGLTFAGDFLWNSVSYEANLFVIVGILDTPS
jgi:hypothetical protein